MKYIVGLVQSHIILLLDQLPRLLSNSPLLFWTATTSTASQSVEPSHQQKYFSLKVSNSLLLSDNHF